MCWKRSRVEFLLVLFVWLLERTICVCSCLPGKCMFYILSQSLPFLKCLQCRVCFCLFCLQTILCTVYKAMIREPSSLSRLVAQAVHGLLLPPISKSPFTYHLTENELVNVSAHGDWMPPFADGSVLLLFQLLGKSFMHFTRLRLASDNLLFIILPEEFWKWPSPIVLVLALYMTCKTPQLSQLAYACISNVTKVAQFIFDINATWLFKFWSTIILAGWLSPTICTVL